MLSEGIDWVIPQKYMRPSLDESDLKLGRGSGVGRDLARIFGFFLQALLDRDG